MLVMPGACEIHWHWSLLVSVPLGMSSLRERRLWFYFRMIKADCGEEESVEIKD